MFTAIATLCCTIIIAPGIIALVLVIVHVRSCEQRLGLLRKHRQRTVAMLIEHQRDLEQLSIGTVHHPSLRLPGEQTMGDELKAIDRELDVLEGLALK